METTNVLEKNFDVGNVPATLTAEIENKSSVAFELAPNTGKIKVGNNHGRSLEGIRDLVLATALPIAAELLSCESDQLSAGRFFQKGKVTSFQVHFKTPSL